MLKFDKVEVLDSCYGKHWSLINEEVEMDLDDVPAADLVKYLLHELQNNMNAHILRREVFQLFVEHNFESQEYEDLGVCEQCGHHSERITYNM